MELIEKTGKFLKSLKLLGCFFFFGLYSETNLSLPPPIFCVRGVIRVDVNIQNIDLDQCVTGDGWFANTHQCNRTTMEVNKVESRTFILSLFSQNQQIVNEVDAKKEKPTLWCNKRTISPIANRG